MNARYRIRRKPLDAIPPEDLLDPEGEACDPYGLWDTHEHRWVNKYGEPDEGYWASNRAVATMRRGDLNYYGGYTDKPGGVLI